MRVCSPRRRSVRWRRTDNLEGNGAEAIVARAESRLAAGDIAGALAELTALSEKSMAVAQPWIAEAKAQIAAEGAIADLQLHAISKMKPGNPAQ